MATEVQINAIADIILKVFDGDPVVFEESLKSIKINTNRVTIENQIEDLRRQKQEYEAQIEAEIQRLLGMK